ncbi:MAG: hypothetical protein WC554_10040 [Clostridia bacterium]
MKTKVVITKQKSKVVIGGKMNKKLPSGELAAYKVAVRNSGTR